MKKYTFIAAILFVFFTTNNASYADSFLYGGQLNAGVGFSNDKKNTANISLGWIGFLKPLYFELSNSYSYMGKRDNVELHFYHFKFDLGYQLSQLFGLKLGMYIGVPLKKNITEHKLIFGLEAGIDLFVYRDNRNSLPICKVGILLQFDMLKSIGNTANIAVYLNMGIVF